MQADTLRVRALALLATGCLPFAAQAEARKVDDQQWEGVERIVAVGDVHGDYDNYLQVLRLAGLVDRKGKWSGGQAHLVQTGDVPDRGPDTRKILEHLAKLKKEARRKGGAVHTLIGNHEAMNVYGDLRYVTPGEYADFRSRNSEKFRELQWQHHLSTLQEREPDAFAAMDLEAFRVEWERDFPLGWVEHRQAWSVSGEYGQWVLGNPTVVRINDTLFLHGGLSAKYCRSSLEDINRQVRDALEHFNYQDPGILEDEFGPLWYRGLATEDEALRDAMVTAILERYGAKRMVVGHTPTQGVVWPRFDGRVLLNDLGIAAYYGGHAGALEISDGQAVAIYPGGRVPIPDDNDGRVAYLEQVVALQPANGHLRSRLERLKMAGPADASPAPATDSQAAADGGPAPTHAEGVEEALTEEEHQAAARAAQVEDWLSPDNCR